jgi:hypothetical protein
VVDPPAHPSARLLFPQIAELAVLQQSAISLPFVSSCCKMEAGECSKEIDPGDPELGRSPTERQDPCNGATNAIENIPQDPSRPEMANDINVSSGDRCDERKKMMEQPGSEGVVAQESDDLSILGDQPTSYTQTPVSTPSQEHTVEVFYDKDGNTKYASTKEVWMSSSPP